MLMGRTKIRVYDPYEVALVEDRTFIAFPTRICQARGSHK
jgi:hypothetical protein